MRYRIVMPSPKFESTVAETDSLEAVKALIEDFEQYTGAKPAVFDGDKQIY